MFDNKTVTSEMSVDEAETAAAASVSDSVCNKACVDSGTLHD